MIPGSPNLQAKPVLPTFPSTSTEEMNIPKMEAVPEGGAEPIAIVGIGCRMPGEVRSASDMWKLLMSKGIGRSAKVPKSRYNIDAYLHPNNERPGSFNVPGGFFLEDDLDSFDATMFNISPVEALWMDPQQRKLLEVVYEALENSGTSLEDAAKQTIGCYIGCFSLDFQFMTMKESDFRHSYAAMGVDTGIISNRISHVLDLKGPSVMMNTACSSSLIALDLACKAIAAGECEGAIVGGTNLMLTVDQQMNTAKMGVLSPNSQSRPFDDSADGYGRGEGIGAIYIKSLKAALRDGDPIRSVIRATATSHNGYNGDGISRPSVKGQTNVISLAYKMGHLEQDRTEYIECHGTGTQVGDPIEIKAIHEALGAARSPNDPILVGSVKANVGHGEAVSSIATLMKATLSLENGIIPPTAAFTKPNSKIPWDQLNVKVVTEPTPIHPTARIGVNAFGYGGTNAHALLERVQVLVPDYRGHKSLINLKTSLTNLLGEATADSERPHLLLFSAHSRPTLENYLGDVASSCGEADLIDLAYTLGVRRTKHEQRTFAVAHKDTFAADTKAATEAITTNPVGESIPAFVFTGQGAQWPHMGSSLLKTYPSVLQNIRKLDQHLSTLKSAPAWTIEDILLNSEKAALVNEPEYSQPLCTAVQIVLVDLLASWGLKPVATIGHSSGEIAAAYAAGIVSAENAITAAYFRGKVAASLNTDGAMLALGEGADKASKFIEEESCRERVVVACHNSPDSVTLSGDRDAIEKLKEAAERRQAFARILKTGGKAYHSHHMAEAASKYLEYLKNESLPGETQLAKIPMFSTVQGTPIQSTPDEYWVSNLNSPVIFNQGVQRMLGDMPDINLLVEVGPHSALSGPLRQIVRAIKRSDVNYLPTLKRAADDTTQVLQLAGNLWVQDAKIDIEAVTSVERLGKDGSVQTEKGTLLVDLPKYHWTYSKPSLAEARASKEHRGMKEGRHDILGRRIIGGSPLEPVWRNVLRQRDLPWLAQHKLAGEVMLPAAAYLALAIEAIEQVNAHSQESLEVHSYTIRDVVISTPIVVPDDDDGTETLFRLRPVDGKLEISSDGKISQWYEFSASCCSYGAWKEAATGLVGLNVKGPSSSHKPHVLPPTPNRGNHLDWLDRERELGVDLGPAFHHISNVYTDGTSHIVRGDMKISRCSSFMEDESRYVLHPTVIDSCLQPFVELLHKGHLDSMRCGIIPTHFGEVTIFPPTKEHLAGQCLVQLWSDNLGQRSYSSNVQLVGNDGSLLVEMIDSRCLLYRAAIPQSMQGNLQKDLYLHQPWEIDSDYLGWAKEANYFSNKSLGLLTSIFLHKDATAQVLCLDHNLVPDVVAEVPGLRMTVAISSEKEGGLIAATYVANENLKFVDSETLFVESGKSGQRYSLVIGSNLGEEELQRVHKLMPVGGHLLLQFENGESDSWSSILTSAGFAGIEQNLKGNFVLSEALEAHPEINGYHAPDNEVILVYRDSPTSLHSLVSSKLKEDGWKVVSQALGAIEQAAEQPVILLADIESPLLIQLGEQDLNGLIALTESAPAMIWVTPGGLLEGDRPEFGTTAGAARTICNEKGSLDLVTVDYNPKNTTEDRVSDLLVDIVRRQRKHGRNGETEYCMQNDLVYIGRLVSNKALNAQFVPDSGEKTRVQQHDGLLLTAETNNGTIEYCRVAGHQPQELETNEVEVQVAALGLSSSDGADDSAFLSHELVGTVVRTGAGVQNVSPGMLVAGFALEHLSTVQRTSSQLVHPLTSQRSPTEVASLPSAFVSAMYGLEELARVAPGENVVILDAMGAVGQAAVQLCRLLGANAIVVTSSSSTEEHLRANESTTDSVAILKWDNGLSENLKAATAGHGADVVLYPATADHSAVIECGRTLAPFGRMISVGHTNDYRTVSSDLPTGSLGLSFFQFDLANVIKYRPQVVATILKRCLAHYEAGRIEALVNVQLKQPTEVNQAISSIPSEMYAGKYVVTYDDKAIFEVVPSPEQLQFRNDATYLLVGCLGGLGRQVALWMAERGAKHLAFVSRSGADSKAAAETIQLLKDSGVESLVLRANITNKDDLSSALSAVDPSLPIRGVINAASIFRDASFSKTTIDAWKEVVETKVNGSLILHELLIDAPLDFFVMTSSVASILGSSGQTNYSAANSFLDSLARHRRSLGLPAVSLVLPAIFGIGHIAENRELEKAIQIKGMYGIREKEMLQAFEVAMTPQSQLPSGTDHIIVGLQPRRFGPAVRAAGAHVLSKENPRLDWIAASVDEQIGGNASSTSSGAGSAADIVATIRQGGSQEGSGSHVNNCAQPTSGSTFDD